MPIKAGLNGMSFITQYLTDKSAFLNAHRRARKVCPVAYNFLGRIMRIEHLHHTEGDDE